MKFYFLGLATLIAVCVGCQSGGGMMGQTAFKTGDGGVPIDSGVAKGGTPIVQTGGRKRGRQYVAPPAEMMMRPGPMVDGPGPGVLNMIGGPPPRSFATRTTQLRFVGPEGMQIGWQIPSGYAENQLTTPGRYNFRQASTYRLKLTNIPGHEGLVLYPTLQVYPSHPETDAYLAHNSVPLQITDEDLDQVESNNFVTKVIYLPSPLHQELAIAGVETLVSTRLDPGVDPVAEADRRGTIMAVLRMGNMDLETPDQPAPEIGNRQGPGGIQQAAHVQQVDGEKGQYVPPTPIGGMAVPGHAVPAPLVMGMPGAPGQSAYNPVGGGTSPSWGMPMTSTPIGLPGPAHLPYGGPAGLRSHTVRNQTKQRIPKPVNDVLIDVKHEPGISIPEPVRHIKYKESHPIYE